MYRDTSEAASANAAQQIDGAHDSLPVEALLPDYVQEMLPLSQRQVEFVAHFQRLMGENRWPSELALAKVGRIASGVDRVKAIIADCRQQTE
jgi:hypothetical protein